MFKDLAESRYVLAVPAIFKYRDFFEGGNSGVEAAIDLANLAKKVTVIEFLPELKVDKILQDKLKSLENVEIITNSQTTGLY